MLRQNMLSLNEPTRLQPYRGRWRYQGDTPTSYMRVFNLPQLCYDEATTRPSDAYSVFLLLDARPLGHLPGQYLYRET